MSNPLHNNNSILPYVSSMTNSSTMQLINWSCLSLNFWPVTCVTGTHRYGVYINIFVFNFKIASFISCISAIGDDNPPERNVSWNV